MKTIATFSVVSALVASALAQDTSQLIPTGISSTCTTFLTQLNSNEEIGTCLGSLLDATASFDPTSNATPDATTITTALNTICAPSFTSCSESNIRSRLADFYTACSNDLVVSPNDVVVSMYDVLYLLVPLKEAICSEDTDGQYCVNKITISTGSNTAAKSSDAPSTGPIVTAEILERLETSLYKYADDSDYPLGVVPKVKRQDNSTETPLAILPDADTYRESSLPYLFISANYTQEQLCTQCTAEVLKAYVSFESITPYALGLSNSPILSGQLALWEKVKQCPNGFANNLLDEAIPSRNQTTSGSDKIVVGSATFGFAAAVAAVMLF